MTLTEFLDHTESMAKDERYNPGCYRGTTLKMIAVIRKLIEQRDAFLAYADSDYVVVKSAVKRESNEELEKIIGEK